MTETFEKVKNAMDALTGGKVSAGEATLLDITPESLSKDRDELVREGLEVGAMASSAERTERAQVVMLDSIVYIARTLAHCASNLSDRSDDAAAWARSADWLSEVAAEVLCQSANMSAIARWMAPEPPSPTSETETTTADTRTPAELLDALGIDKRSPFREILEGIFGASQPDEQEPLQPIPSKGRTAETCEGCPISERCPDSLAHAG